MDIAKLETGPCNVYLDDVDVGALDDGVTVEVTSETTDLTASQFGTTPINKVITGVSVKVSFAMKEVSLDSFRAAISNSDAIVTDAVDPTKKKLQITPKAGTDLRSIASKLVLKPIIGGVETADANKFYTAPVAAPDAGTVSIAFGNTEQRKINATFICFPDPLTNEVLILGDETAAA